MERHQVLHTVGINTTDSNITFDANSNIVVTGIITATRFKIMKVILEIGSKCNHS